MSEAIVVRLNGIVFVNAAILMWYLAIVYEQNGVKVAVAN